MISGWLIKIAVAVAIAGFLVVELGSPLLARATLDNTAHQAADDSARELLATHDQQRAANVADQDARDDHAHLDTWDIDAQGAVHVTLSKEAKSYVLHNFKPTRDWYHVRASASAIPHP
jgi:Flp pilus assembly protein TadG